MRKPFPWIRLEHRFTTKEFDASIDYVARHTFSRQEFSANFDAIFALVGARCAANFLHEFLPRKFSRDTPPEVVSRYLKSVPDFYPAHRVAPSRLYPKFRRKFGIEPLDDERFHLLRIVDQHPAGWTLVARYKDLVLYSSKNPHPSAGCVVFRVVDLEPAGVLKNGMKRVIVMAQTPGGSSFEALRY